MDSLAERHLQRPTLTYVEVCGKGVNQLCFDEVAIDRATEYAAEDAEVTFELHRAMRDRVRERTDGDCANGDAWPSDQPCESPESSQ